MCKQVAGEETRDCTHLYEVSQVRLLLRQRHQIRNQSSRMTKTAAPTAMPATVPRNSGPLPRSMDASAAVTVAGKLECQLEIIGAPTGTAHSI